MLPALATSMACWSAFLARRTASWACCTRSTAITSARTTPTCSSFRAPTAVQPDAAPPPSRAQRQRTPGRGQRVGRGVPLRHCRLPDDELIEASINHGRPLELPPQSGVIYKAFVDASWRGDAYTVAIGHRDKGAWSSTRCAASTCHSASIVFDPMVATKQFADLCKEYHVGTVVGDNFAGGWVSEAWRKDLISYIKSELTKSEIYLEVLPLFTRGLVSLPDHPRLLKELRLLERRVHRSGKDSVDHGRSGHDDYANAVCGCLRSLAFASWDTGMRLTATATSSPAASRNHSSTLRRKRGNIGTHLVRRSPTTQGDGGHDQTSSGAACNDHRASNRQRAQRRHQQRRSTCPADQRDRGGDRCCRAGGGRGARQGARPDRRSRAGTGGPAQGRIDPRSAPSRPAAPAETPSASRRCRRVRPMGRTRSMRSSPSMLLPPRSCAPSTAVPGPTCRSITEAKRSMPKSTASPTLKPHHLWGQQRRPQLPTVEAAARALPGVSPDFSLMTMKLPAFDTPNQLVWPPYEMPLAVQVVASMVPIASDPRQYTAVGRGAAGARQAARPERSGAARTAGRGRRELSRPALVGARSVMSRATAAAIMRSLGKETNNET